MVSSNLSWYQNHSILIYHVNVVESVNETKFSDRIGSGHAYCYEKHLPKTRIQAGYTGEFGKSPPP